MSSAPARFGLARIGQIAVTVKDIDRAVAFYRDTLGIPFLFQVPGIAFFDCAGVRLMLSVPEGSNAVHSSSILYYYVANIDEAYQQLTERGVHFVDAPHHIARLADHDLWIAFFRDSEENLLALMSEKPLEAR